MSKINIVVLSGKGGTGKTLVSTNLALCMGANYVDADVEEPNGFIFLKPKIEKVDSVEVDIPIIDTNKCQKCYKCMSFCEFNALAISKNEILVFDKLCHSCGGCKLVCPFDAISYKKKKIGIIENGNCRNIKCARGVVDIGEVISIPLIKKLLNNLNSDINIIDSAPGTSCNVVNTLSYADCAILVTEPTEFGLHDLKRAVILVENLEIPFGVVINRVIKNNNIIKKYCESENIKILSEINYDKKIVELYSNGYLLVDNDSYKEVFNNLSKKVEEYLLCK